MAFSARGKNGISLIYHSKTIRLSNKISLFGSLIENSHIVGCKYPNAQHSRLDYTGSVVKLRCNVSFNAIKQALRAGNAGTKKMTLLPVPGPIVRDKALQ